MLEIHRYEMVVSQEVKEVGTKKARGSVAMVINAKWVHIDEHTPKHMNSDTHTHAHTHERIRTAIDTITHKHTHTDTL